MSQLNRGTLSVVICNYNHAHYIAESLQPLLSQSFRPQEVIVIDDGSTDNSVEVIEEFAKADPIVHLYRNDRNRGVFYSANRGLSIATGEYILYVSADDAVLPGLFKQSMSLHQQFSQAGISTGRMWAVDANGLLVDGRRKLYPITLPGCRGFLTPSEVLRRMLWQGEIIVSPTAAVRRMALLEVGGFREELGPFADSFAYHAIALKYGACYISEPLALWRRSEAAYSSRFSEDVSAASELGRRAVDLMRSEFRSLFPEKLIERYETRWRCAIASGCLERAQKNLSLQIAQAFPRATILDRALAGTVNWAFRALTLTTGLLVFLRFRTRDIVSVASRKFSRM
jgi:glycosyltransferase involved in cell wall biosynthesis